MNRDFDDELGRSRGRKSRRKPSMRDTEPKHDGNSRIAARKTAATDSTKREKTTSPRMRARNEKAKKRRRIIAMIVAECFTLMFIFGYAFVMKRLNLIQRSEEFKQEDIRNPEITIDTLEKMEGYWTIALFGVDSRGSNVEKGTNADVNMICNINQDTGEIRIVSVFRDSYLNIDDEGSYNKINQAYFRGGPSQAVKALNKNLDLDITDYVTFNWKAVADAINILGGIDLELSKAEFYYINSFITETVKATGVASKHLTHAGMNHLDGVQAVAYGRLRLMDTDFARTERQRKVIELAFEKAKKADFVTLNNIIVTVFPQVSTSIDFNDMVRIAQIFDKYHLGENGGFPFARGDANMGKKGACVIPQTLETNVVELHQFLFDDDNYTPTDSVKKISAKISADSGMYKQGTSIDHVSTEGGVISKPKTPTKAADEKEEETTKAEESTEETTMSGIDIDGDGIPDIDLEDEEFWANPDNWPRDEEGNVIYPGWNNPGDGTGPGSESGSSSTRPGTTKPGTTKPDSTKPSSTDTTKPDSTKPSSTRPGETETSDATRPTETLPSGTTAGELEGPGGGMSGTDSPGNGNTEVVVPPPGAEDENNSSVGPGGSAGPGVVSPGM